MLTESLERKLTSLDNGRKQKWSTRRRSTQTIEFLDWRRNWTIWYYKLEIRCRAKSEMLDASSVDTMATSKVSAWPATKQGANSTEVEQVREKTEDQVRESDTKAAEEEVHIQDSGLSHQDKVHQGHIEVVQGHQAGEDEWRHHGGVTGVDHMTDTECKDLKRDEGHLRGVDHLMGEATQAEVEEIPREFNFDNNQPGFHNQGQVNKFDFHNLYCKPCQTILCDNGKT